MYLKSCLLSLSLLLSLSVSSFAGVIQIEKQGDGYLVMFQTSADGRVEKALYTKDDLSKITPLVAKALSGLSKEADRVIIHLDDVGEVISVSFQNQPESRAGAKADTIKGKEDLLGKDITAIADLKTDAASKIP